ncbi:right-handed parallel beta-helix repeat-containing protein [Paenibacillus antri]|nr:right-handed parallel beta-helix repeat-containing protein [Paenibacillus antri]
MALTLCAAMMMGAIPSMSAADPARKALTDIQNHWAAEGIMRLQALGWVGGYEDGTFRPDRSVTRAEFIAVLIRALKLKPAGSFTVPFRDVPADYWATDEIAAGRSVGLLAGDPDGAFRPNDGMTRAEAASVLARAYLYPEDDQSGFAFRDVSQEHWAYESVMTLAGNGIVEGNSQGLFQPNRSVTRAEVAVMLLRTIDSNVRPASSVISGPPVLPNVYELIPRDWNIYSDGTHAKETTKGFNDALVWAHKAGYTVFKVPAGTYLISKPVKNTIGSDGYITMVPNMTFWADDNAVFQKEANDSESYTTLLVPYGANNVVIRGGTYRGDKDTHNYAVKDTYGPGTHEGGYGISIAGANNVTIDGVKAVHFTGDGAIVGGKPTLIQDIYETGFTSGNIDEAGNMLADPAAVRTKTAVTLDPAKKPMFATEKYFELSNPRNLPGMFDIYFYRADGSFLSRQTNVAMRQILSIPSEANHFHLVFRKASATDAYVEVWNRVQSDSVVIKNSEFAFNRRQGITVAGGNNVTIEGNKIHDIGGTAPMSGIDVEGGYGENGMLNTNIYIRKNEFYNNRLYDIILYDGRNAVVEGNRLGSSKAIGLAISDPFTGATVQNNTFVGSGISAAHDATFINNTMSDATAAFQGPNVVVDQLTLTDSVFTVTNKVKFGVQVSNLRMTNTKKGTSGITLYGEPIHMKNVSMKGESALRNLTGEIADGSIFDNLVIEGYNSTYGIDLPRGTYNNCKFTASGQGSGTISVNGEGTYALNKCEISVSGRALHVSGDGVGFTIRDSKIGINGSWGQALYVEQARNLLIEGNEIRAEHLAQPVNLIQFYKSGEKVNRNAVGNAVIKSNTIVTNNASKGVSTQDGGAGAPAFTVTDNVLVNATLDLKKADVQRNNELISGQ